MTRSQDITTAPLSEECSAPGVPIRTSSNLQTQTLTSAPAQGVVSEPKTISRKGSKDSIKGKRRSGSLRSVRRSKENFTTAGVAGQEKAGPSLQAASSPEKPKKRGVSRFLSLLGCCGAQDDAKNPDVSEPAVPPKKAKVLQAKSGRQPTPAVKVEKSAAESSTGESKEMPEETIGGTPYSEQTAAAKPKMVTRRSKENVPTEKSAGLGNGHTSEKEPTNPIITTGDQPLPPLPTSGLLANRSSTTAEPSSGPDVVSVLPPNPPVTSSAEEDVEEEGQVINDRTPEQARRDSDIEMTQAPPIAPEAGDSQRTTESEKEQQQMQASLPPPPPRNNQNRGSSPADRSPAAERQQWLLPPIQPRFQGKKCLVLDLDETLVHSSFKVNTNHDRAFGLELMDLDSSPSRLHNSCGNRGPVP